MSYTVPSPAPRARPSTVRLAVTLLYAAAVLEVINVILTLLYASKIADATKRVYEQAGVKAGASLGPIVDVIVGFVIVVILVLLGYFVGRGNQVARILTWVVGGIAFCCSILALGSALFQESLWDQARKTNPQLPTWDEYQKIVYTDVPGWYRPVTTVVSILLLLAIIVPIVLLALPASHPYFRKQQQEWEPPVPGQDFPGHPGQPGQPGQPGEPGSPGDGPPQS